MRSAKVKKSQKIWAFQLFCSFLDGVIKDSQIPEERAKLQGQIGSIAAVVAITQRHGRVSIAGRSGTAPWADTFAA